MSNGTCTLYRGGFGPAELACGGPLPWSVSGGMGRKEMEHYLRYCPQCGKRLVISDKVKPDMEVEG